jgi:hypothetical protein
MTFGKAEVRQQKAAEPEASLDAILHGLDADRSSTIQRGRETSLALHPPLNHKWDGTLCSRVP